MVVFLIITLFGIASSAYIIDETEQVIITRWGRIVGQPKKEPGLYFKVPFIDHVNTFPKNLLEWDGDPDQISTLDKTYIFVDAFARWRIVDPVLFFQTVNNFTSALGRLDDIIDPAVRNLITSNRLIETARNSDRKMDTFEIGISEHDQQQEHATQYQVITGREKITIMIREQAQPKLKEFGIELVDVKIKRINYVEEVRDSVYGRMIAERKQIAEKFRSEGKGEAQKILGEKERELKRISSEAYKTAQIIKGEADAKVTKIFADAYGVDPEFYSFIKSLELYPEALTEESSLILSTDSEFLKYMLGGTVSP